MEEEIKEPEVTEEEEVEEPVESEEDSEEEEQEDEPFEIEEPKVRKTPKDYILERRSKRLEKYENRKDDDDDFEDDDDDDDVSEQITKKVLQKLTPIIGNQSFTQELAEVVTKYPELKGKEEIVKKYAEAYPTTPLEFIAQGVLFNKYSKASGRSEAQEKAKSEQKGGNVKRPRAVKEKSAWDMTEEEFLAATNKARTSR